MFAVEVFDPATFVGLFGLIAGPLAIIATGWALLKTQGEARWRSAAEAEQMERSTLSDGIRIRDERIRSTNEWAATIEARYRERDELIAALNERVGAQASHIEELLKRTPEELWRAVEAHAKAAQEQWALARDFQVHAVASIEGKLDEILEGVKRIEPGE